MNRYKVLLVDDEEEVIQVILKKIDWIGLGFSVMGNAGDGVKALEMIEEEQPDVVISDIKMPYMDGLELSRRIKKEYPSIKIILLTGFDEFEYAKEAVHLEIEEYILKPIDSEEFSKVLTRIHNTIDEEKAQKSNAERLQNYYMDSLPQLQANFYSMLIEGRIKADELEKYKNDYSIDLPGPVYACIVLHTSQIELPEDLKPVLVGISVDHEARERFKNLYGSKFFMYLGNTVMIVQLKDESQLTEVTDELNRFCRMVKQTIGVVVTAGVGKAVREVLELSDSYTGAREAVTYRVLFGRGRAINITEAAPYEQQDTAQSVSDDSDLHELLKNVRLYEADMINEAVDRYIDHTLASQKSLTGYRFGLMELMSALYRFMANNQIDIKKLPDFDDRIYNDILQMNVEQVRDWLKGVCVAAHSQIAEGMNDSSKSFVSKAMDYISDNYGDENLSLDSISGELGVSSSYFSSTFKKYTGKSFVSYLTDFRMKKAQYLLIEKNEKTYVVAQEVGYSDPNYFSYVFKKQFGMSPSRYKKEHENT